MIQHDCFPNLLPLVDRVRGVRALHGVRQPPILPEVVTWRRAHGGRMWIGAVLLWGLLVLPPLGVGLHVRAVLPRSTSATAADGPTPSPASLPTPGWLLHFLTVAPAAHLTAFAGTAEVAAWSPNGRYLAVGYSAGSLLVWDVAQRRLAYRMWNAHRRFVGALAWSPDGRVLASAAADGRAILWRFGRGGTLVPLLTLPTAAGHVPAIAFSPRGDRVAIADGLHSVALWPMPMPHTASRAPASSVALHTGQHAPPSAHHALRILRVPGHTTALAWSPDGTRLAVGTLEGDVALWPAGEGWQRVTRPLGSRVWALAWSPDGLVLAAGCADGGVRLLAGADLRPRQLLLTPFGSAPVLQAPDYGQPATHAGTGSKAGAGTGRRAGVGAGTGTGQGPRPATGAAINTMSWSPSGDLLAVTATGSPLRLWQPSSGAVVATYRANWDQNAVAWRPDGRLLAVAADDGSVTLLRASAPALVEHILCGAATARHCAPLAALAGSGRGGTLTSYMGR